MKKVKWTKNDMPDLTGKIAIVTGANTGLGFETALGLAEKRATVVLAVRSMERGQKAIYKILETVPGASVSLQKLDLGSLESVRVAAEEIKSQFKQIDILINNAGIFSGTGKTVDGFELRFGTNHLGHFALTGLLLDTILATPNARIVTVESVAHKRKKKLSFDDVITEPDKCFPAYGRSKLANLLFTYELQRRLEGANTIAVAAHPGVAYSEIVRSFPKFIVWAARFVMQPTAIGALPTLRAASDPDVSGGQYYGPRGRKERRGYPIVVKSNAMSHDEDLQKKLWEMSEEFSGVSFPVDQPT